MADIISAGAVTIPADFRFSEFVLRNYPVINISPNLAPQLFRFWTPKSIRISPRKHAFLKIFRLRRAKSEMTSATIRADSQIPEFCAPQLSRRKDGINLQHRTYQQGYLLCYRRYQAHLRIMPGK